LCTACQKPLFPRYDLAAAGRVLTREALATREKSLWRYREVLPLPGEVEPVSLGEGGTPLLPVRRWASDLGFSNLRVKDEAQNPTQSFKARGMTVAVSMAKYLGAKKLAVPTAGNAGGALAAYAARAGLEAHIFMPSDTPRANVIECRELGAHVTMITTSPDKGEDAKALGAHEVLLSSDAEAMTSAANRFDIILNTIPVTHDVGPYLNLLNANGVMIIVGAIDALPGLHGGALVMRNRVIAGSLIGGLPETQEMLDFCGEQNILPETETIGIVQINEAWERMEKGDVRYRFVIDMMSLAE